MKAKQVHSSTRLENGLETQMIKVLVVVSLSYGQNGSNRNLVALVIFSHFV